MGGGCQIFVWQPLPFCVSDLHLYHFDAILLYPLSAIKYYIISYKATFKSFIQNEKSGGLVLALSVVVALLWANSPLYDFYFHFFEQTLGFTWNGNSYFEYNLHHWINDGLMALFFFVVGLELKREMVGGELSNPRKAILPIAAALGGMVVPAFI